MVRLISFLNEQGIDLEHVREILSVNCQPFLNEIRKNSAINATRMLFSGREDTRPVLRKKVRQDRKPKDTSKEVHETLDKMFQDAFGIKARSQTLFTFPTSGLALGYGNPYYVFPVGKYEIIWSDKIGDLYGDLLNWMRDTVKPRNKKFVEMIDQEFDRLKIDKVLSQKLAQYLKKNLPIDKTYQKGNLWKAVNYNNEIMLYCKEWIGVHSQWKKITDNPMKSFDYLIGRIDEIN